MSQNQCDGCYRRLPLNDKNMHYEEYHNGLYTESRVVMVCQAYRYKEKNKDERTQDSECNTEG